MLEFTAPQRSTFCFSAKVWRCRPKGGRCRGRSTSPPLLRFIFTSGLIPPGNTYREGSLQSLLSYLHLLSDGSITTLESDILLKSGSRSNKTLFKLLLLLVNSLPIAWVSLNVGWYKFWWPATGDQVTSEYWLPLCWYFLSPMTGG